MVQIQIRSIKCAGKKGEIKNPVPKVRGEVSIQTKTNV